MQTPTGGCTTAQKKSRATKMDRENSRFSDLVGISKNPLVAEAVQKPAAVTVSFSNNKVTDCLSVFENECSSRFSQAGLTFSAHGPFWPCASV